MNEVYFLQQTICGARCAAIYSDRRFSPFRGVGDAHEPGSLSQQTPVAGDELSLMSRRGAPRYSAPAQPARALSALHPSRNRSISPSRPMWDCVFIVTSANQAP